MIELDLSNDMYFFPSDHSMNDDLDHCQDMENINYILSGYSEKPKYRLFSFLQGSPISIRFGGSVILLTLPLVGWMNAKREITRFNDALFNATLMGKRHCQSDHQSPPNFLNWSKYGDTGYVCCSNTGVFILTIRLKL